MNWPWSQKSPDLNPLDMLQSFMKDAFYVPPTPNSTEAMMIQIT